MIDLDEGNLKRRHFMFKKEVPPSFNQLYTVFTRDELRLYARTLGVRKGRDKNDTIRNILDSGCARVLITLSK